MRLSVSLVVVASLLACVTDDNFVWIDDLPDAQLAPAPYRIRGGDRLQVTVFKQDALSGEALVRADGRITVALIGDISVAGQTPPEAGNAIAAALSGTGFIDKPSVQVAVNETRAPQFAIVGEVRTPGSFELMPGTSVLDALALAGGLSEFAQKDKIFVVRKSPQKNQRIRFSWEKLSRSDDKSLKFVIEGGDIIVVE